MRKSPKSRAEEMFSASSKKSDEARKEMHAEERRRAEHIAGLRALRLAKEAADREAAAQAKADKAAAKAAGGIPLSHQPVRRPAAAKASGQEHREPPEDQS